MKRRNYSTQSDYWKLHSMHNHGQASDGYANSKGGELFLS